MGHSIKTSSESNVFSNIGTFAVGACLVGLGAIALTAAVHSTVTHVVGMGVVAAAGIGIAMIGAEIISNQLQEKHPEVTVVPYARVIDESDYCTARRVD